MSAYNPQTSIDLAKKLIPCDDCGKKTKSIFDHFLDKDPFSDYYDTEGIHQELTAKILKKDGGFRCSNCESLNRDFVITMLYHKKHNPEIFKEEMKKRDITDELKEYET